MKLKIHHRICFILIFISFAIFVDSIDVRKAEALRKRQRASSSVSTQAKVNRGSAGKDVVKRKVHQDAAVGKVVKKVETARRSAPEKVTKIGRRKAAPARSHQSSKILAKNHQKNQTSVSEYSGDATSRQIQQWQVALVVPPGLQQSGGLPPPAQQESQGSHGPPPPGSIWIQIPGYYPSQPPIYHTGPQTMSNGQNVPESQPAPAEDSKPSTSGETSEPAPEETQENQPEESPKDMPEDKPEESEAPGSNEDSSESNGDANSSDQNIEEQNKPNTDAEDGDSNKEDESATGTSEQTGSEDNQDNGSSSPEVGGSDNDSESPPAPEEMPGNEDGENDSEKPDSMSGEVENVDGGSNNTPEDANNSESAPDNSGTMPEGSDAMPENSETTPNNTENEPENSDNAPDNSENAPDNSENSPDNTENAPDNSENGSDIASENSDAMPDGSENAPDGIQQPEDSSSNGDNNSENGADSESHETVGDAFLPQETDNNNEAGETEYKPSNMEPENNETNENTESSNQGNDNSEVPSLENGGDSDNGSQTPDQTNGDSPAAGEDNDQNTNGDSNSVDESPQNDGSLKNACKDSRGQYPSKKSCRRFVNCWDGQAVEQECPSGLVFSEMGYCDFPYNVECGSRPNEKQEHTTCDTPYATYRSASNCSEFFVCVASDPVKFSCPDDLNYNDEIGVCDFPYRVDCGSSPSSPPSDIPEDSPPAEDLSGDESNGESSNGNSVEDSPNNQEANVAGSFQRYTRRKVVSGLVDTGARCRPGTLTAIGRGCARVAFCSRSGFAQLISCPSRTAYDAATKRCIIAHKAKCT